MPSGPASKCSSPGRWTGYRSEIAGVRPVDRHKAIDAVDGRQRGAEMAAEAAASRAEASRAVEVADVSG